MSVAGDYAADPDAWADARRVETRATQGLPPQVSDPVAVAQIAANVGPWLEEQEKGRGEEKRGAA